MKILILFCLLSVCFIVGGVFATPLMLIPAGMLAAGALGASYNIGTRQGFVVNEDDLPQEIYQVMSIAMDGSYPVAILRNSKKKRIACKSCAQGGFFLFEIVGEGSEKFFIPGTLGSLEFTGPLGISIKTA